MPFTTTMKTGLTSSPATIYTSPMGTTSIVFNGFVANKSETDTCYFTLTYFQENNSITLLNNIPIPVGSSVLIPKKVIPSQAYIQAKVDTVTSGKVDVSLEILTV